MVTINSAKYCWNCDYQTYEASDSGSQRWCRSKKRPCFEVHYGNGKCEEFKEKG